MNTQIPSTRTTTLAVGCQDAFQERQNQEDFVAAYMDVFTAILKCILAFRRLLTIAPALPAFLTYTDVGNAGVARSNHRPPSMAVKKQSP
jgi:hypothetical protein